MPHHTVEVVEGGAQRPLLRAAVERKSLDERQKGVFLRGGGGARCNADFLRIDDVCQQVYNDYKLLVCTTALQKTKKAKLTLKMGFLLACLSKNILELLGCT